MVGRVVIPVLMAAVCGGCVGAGLVEGSPAAVVLGVIGVVVVVVNTTSVVWAHQGLVAAAVHETLLGRRREP